MAQEVYKLPQLLSYMKRTLVDIYSIIRIYDSCTISYKNNTKEIPVIKDIFKAVGESVLQINCMIKNNKISINVLEIYPFIAPYVTVNDIDYLKFLIWPLLEAEHIRLKGRLTCLHCESMLQSHNWCPGLHLINILKEIEDNIGIQQRLTERFYVDKIRQELPLEICYIIKDYL